MKIILSTLLLFASFLTFSQTEPEIYIGEDKLRTINQERESLKNQGDKNREKALSVVAPIDEALDNLRESGQLPEPSQGTSLESMIESATNKPKMVDYSDVKFEEGFTKNEDGTWSPKENSSSNENNEKITVMPYEYKNKESISIFSKNFTIIMLIILWFAAGFVINYIIYNNSPDHELGTSKTAKLLHILANIVLAIAILVTLSR